MIYIILGLVSLAALGPFGFVILGLIAVAVLEFKGLPLDSKEK